MSANAYLDLRENVDWDNQVFTLLESAAVYLRCEQKSSYFSCLLIFHTEIHPKSWKPYSNRARGLTKATSVLFSFSMTRRQTLRRSYVARTLRINNDLKLFAGSDVGPRL